MELATIPAHFWLLSGLAIVVSLGISAFFSSSETAFTGVSRARIHQMARTGNQRATRVNALLQQRERVIGSILLGNNASNIVATTIATALFTRILGEEVGVLVATIVMTILIVVLAEVLPKFLAIRNPDKIIMRFVPVLGLYVRLTKPISAMFPRTSFKRRERSEEEKEAAVEEVRGLIEMHHRSGDVVKHERDMLRGILDLKELDVSAVMIHRKHVAMLDINQDIAAMEAEIVNAEVARLPVFEGDPDNVIGVLNTRQARRALRKGTSTFDASTVRQLMQSPWFVPDTAALDKQLRAFLKQRSHFAVVVDEYGSIQGVVTISDILEEVFGDIDEDEHEETPSDEITVLEGGGIQCEGQTPVRDINRQMDWNLPYDEAATVGGLVISRAQNIPPAQYSIDIDGYRVLVMGRTHNRITSVVVSSINGNENGSGD